MRSTDTQPGEALCSAHLAAHIAAVDAEAVRGRTAELEKAHQKWMRQLDKEIAAASLLQPLPTEAEA